MSDVLRFEVELRPLGVNNLYANGRPMRTRTGKTYTPRVAKTSTRVYKQRILEAAKAAAAEQGWDLGYEGTASLVVIDYRKGSQGLDADSVTKAILDAIQPRRKAPVPTPLGDDREVWEQRVLIANSDRPRIVVIVRKTTRDAIAYEARQIDDAAVITNLPVIRDAVMLGKVLSDWEQTQAEANRRTASKPKPPRDIAEIKNGEAVSFAERDRILRDAGIGGRAAKVTR